MADTEVEKRGRSMHVLKNQSFKDPYEERWYERTSGVDIDNPRTTPELLGHLSKNKNVEVDARILCTNGKSKGLRKMNREQFLRSWVKSDSKFREGIVDYFGTDTYPYSGDTVNGRDFVPLLGGPFYKQQYYFDYVKGHQQAFYAYHHDPIANAVIQIIRDFTLGRDWKVEFGDNEAAKILWEAFCEVNDFRDSIMDKMALELSMYGEDMLWWLPNHETKIVYNVAKGQMPPKGALPRVRLIDPSAIWEIVTYPEDITRVLWYQWVAPTQYQLYSGNDGGKVVPSTKFIYQQVPAEQVDHFKINTVSNEKRGRSDLYPVLDYLKRLRDSVQYSIIGMQKQVAWAIDTSIDGSQADIDNYVAEQSSLGTIPPAGSEFVHSKKVERKYLANEGGARGATNPSFEWCLSMIAAGTGIPIQYFGTHLSGASTRASALVATEPVAKKFEMRQQVYRRIIVSTAKRLFRQFGLENVDIEVTFPELVVQDRSAKLKDLALSVQQRWISPETAAGIAAKELQIDSYQYEEEMEKLNSDPNTAPLTTPGDEEEEDSEPTGVSAQDRRALSMSRGM